jgi:hypothetical protein
MLGQPLFSSKNILLFGFATILFLILEIQNFLNFTFKPWRGFQWLGGLQFLSLVFFLYLCSILFIYRSSARENSLAKMHILKDLGYPLFMSQSLLLGLALKKLLGRSGYLNDGAFFSSSFGLFPSGHTLVGLLSFTLLCKTILFLFKESHKVEIAILTISFLALMLLTVSLFISGDHYLSDILASITIYLLFNKLWVKLLDGMRRRLPSSTLVK